MIINLIFLEYPFCIFDTYYNYMETTLNKNSIDLGVKLGTFLFIITAIIYVVDLNYFSR